MTPAIDDDRLERAIGRVLSAGVTVSSACLVVGLVLSMPRQGLGNSAIASVANDEQLARFAGVWASMAITEPSFGSDSAAVSTTATRDGDDFPTLISQLFEFLFRRCPVLPSYP